VQKAGTAVTAPETRIACRRKEFGCFKCWAFATACVLELVSSRERCRIFFRKKTVVNDGEMLSHVTMSFFGGFGPVIPSGSIPLTSSLIFFVFFILN